MIFATINTSRRSGESYAEAKDGLADFFGWIIANEARSHLSPGDLDRFFDDVASAAKFHLPVANAQPEERKAEAAKREAA